MTIGEFARQAGLSVSAVRFYADRGLLPPARIDEVTGYRHYDRQQVRTAVLIRELRRMDMPLADVERALALPIDGRRQLVAAHVDRLETAVGHARDIARSLEPDPIEKECPMPTTTIDSADLANALDQVLTAAGTDPRRPNLMGVLFEGKDGTVRIVATDSHRCSVRDLVPSGRGGDFTAVVAAAALEDWRAELDGLVATDLRLDLDDRSLSLCADGLDLTALILPISFPAYEDLLTPGSDDRAKLVVDREAFHTALASFDGDGPVRLDWSTGQPLRITRRAAEAHIDVTVEGAGGFVHINPRFGADAVRHAVGADVLVEVDDPLHLVVFRSADDGTYTSLLMPVKVESDA